MNIGIDARLLSGRMTGISRYLRNILEYLPSFDFNNKYYLFTDSEITPLNNFYSVISAKKKKLPRQIYSHYWLNYILPKYLSENKIDIFFTPYLLVPLSKSLCKNVIVIHDSMPKACEQYYSFHYKKYLELILPGSIRRSDAIITDSKSAMHDIIKYNGVSPEKINYMHLWTNENYKVRNFSNEEKKILLSKYNLPEKYILYVGAIEERKNIKGLLKISDILHSKGNDIKFVLIGKGGFGHKRLFNEINNRKDRVIHKNSIDEEDLPLVYNLAKIFLFPSYYEGFGLPPLEAMKSGIPILTSDNSSLPEVVGNGGLMYDADDNESFVTNIINLLKDDELYRNMSKRALNQAKKFTAQRQLPKLIEIFNKTIVS